MQLFNFTSKDDNQHVRPWHSSAKHSLSRQLSNIDPAPIGNLSMSSPEKNCSETAYQRSISIENATIDEYFKRANRAVSVEPSLITGPNDSKFIYQQKTLPIHYDSSTKINNQFTLSSETINQST